MNKFDVAIIGLGPAGATLANLLGQYGLSVIVLEKELGIYPLPRAIHFDGEVMRIFETAGLREPVQAISRPGLKGMHFNNAAGETMLIRAGSSALGQHGFANNHYFHQPELEAVLRAGLERYPTVQVRSGHEVVSIDNGGEHASLQVKNLQSGETYDIQADYIVGCDGARSLARKTIATSFSDLGLQQAWLVFDVRLKTEVPSLPEYTIQLCDPARPMTICNVTGNRRRWEIMVLPGDDPEHLVKHDTLWQLVSKWVTPAQADIERAVIYTFRSAIADRWRKGRVLLAGDAAHLTPPFLGQGMCAAIRDASNLAWKLHAVLRMQADTGLLDTYGSERAPHVRAFIELAVKLGNIIQTIDPAEARSRDAKFKAGSPEIFEYPAPRLGTGIWHGDQAPVAQIFPQPKLADGRLLDAVLGSNFGVIGEQAVVDQVSAPTRERWRAQGLVCLTTQDFNLQAWLEQHRVRAVMLRPDRYILGVAQSSQELEHLSTFLPAATQTLAVALAPSVH